MFTTVENGRVLNITGKAIQEPKNKLKQKQFTSEKLLSLPKSYGEADSNY